MDVNNEYRSSASASNLMSNLNTLILKEQLLMADSSNYAEMLSVLKDICETIGLMCYDPLDVVDVNISLAWAETLQYLDNPTTCIKNIDCCNELIESFVKIVKIAIGSSYTYLIDLVKLRNVFAELRVLIKSW
ncbi:MAG: hypothetical protein QXV30_02385 [Desulfurococcaceae archaeon]